MSKKGKLETWVIAVALVVALGAPLKIIGDYTRVTSQIKLEEKLRGEKAAYEYAKSWKKTVDTSIGRIILYGEHKALDSYIQKFENKGSI